MTIGKYKSFSNRLVGAMKSAGHIASRSPSGICITTLSQFAGASDQICRRYIRGDALPDYEKIIKIAACLNVSPGWLLFGDEGKTDATNDANLVDADFLHYILSKSHHLYREETGDTDDYADFVLQLIRDVKEISTTEENLQKIIVLAINSISSYKEMRIKKAL